GEELPDKASTPGAQRGAHGDFALAASATHEEEIGKINATNEEDGTNGGEKHEERLAKIFTYHAIFVAVNRDAPSLVGFGIGLLNPRRDAFHLFASLLQRDTGFQAGPGNHPVIVAGNLCGFEREVRQDISLLAI